MKNQRLFVTEVNWLITMVVFALEISHFMLALTGGNIDFWAVKASVELEPYTHTVSQIVWTYLLMAVLLTLSLLCSLQTLHLIRMEGKL